MFKKEDRDFLIENAKKIPLVQNFEEMSDTELMEVGSWDGLWRYILTDTTNQTEWDRKRIKEININSTVHEVSTVMKMGDIELFSHNILDYDYDRDNKDGVPLVKLSDIFIEWIAEYNFKI